jgi:rubrerythrin
MKSIIDQKLDEFYSKESPRFMDETIWKEVFDIAISYEKTDVEQYNYQIKRLRDLKNTHDYYKELGRQEGLEKAKLKRMEY